MTTQYSFTKQEKEVMQDLKSMMMAAESTEKDSDLPRILNSLAEKAIHQYRHLEKHPEKTESKMFPGPRETS